MVKLPDTFIKQTQLLMGEERFARYLAAFSEEPPVSIRLNPLHSSSFTPHPSLQPVPWCPLGMYLDHRPNFTFDPLLHAGCYYVQEAASMFIHYILEQELKGRGEAFGKMEEPLQVLDLCAAPGGKSTCAVSALPRGTRLWSNEPVRKRAGVLAENIEKWGYPDCTVTNNYPEDYVRAGLRFDIILCDVPCSGEGMFRRDPLTISEWSPQQVEKCWRLQREIVSQAWQCLKPGGLIIYSTCTLNTKENEENVMWMQKQLEAELLPVGTQPEWGICGSLLPGFSGPVYRFIPGITRSEGLFVAVLRKPDGKGKEEKERRNEDSKKRKEKGLNVIPPLTARHPPLVDLDYATAISYLRGEALHLPADVPQGLVTVGFQGHPLGQVKNIGTRANNLYPKDWRIKSTHIPQEYEAILRHT